MKCSSLSPFLHNKYSSWVITMFNDISLINSLYWYSSHLDFSTASYAENGLRIKQMKASMKYICITLHCIYISACIGQAIQHNHLRRLTKYVSICFPLVHFLSFMLWQCADRLVRFTYENWLVRTRKRSWFGLKYLFRSPQTGRRCHRVSVKTGDVWISFFQVFFAINAARNCSQSLLKYIQWFHTHSC